MRRADLLRFAIQAAAFAAAVWAYAALRLLFA